MRIKYGMLFILATIIVILTSACSNKINDTINSDQDLNSAKISIYLEQVIHTFKKHGVMLTEADDVNPNNVFIKTLHDVKPAVYMTDKDQMLSIYIFNSKDGVIEGIKDFEKKTATVVVESHTKYQIHNVLMLYASEGGVDPRVQAAVDDFTDLS